MKSVSDSRLGKTCILMISVFVFCSLFISLFCIIELLFNKYYKTDPVGLCLFILGRM